MNYSNLVNGVGFSFAFCSIMVFAGLHVFLIWTIESFFQRTFNDDDMAFVVYKNSYLERGAALIFGLLPMCENGIKINV